MDNKNDNAFFSVSLPKLLIMSTCTLAMYQFYWLYKNWSIIKRHENSKIMPVWRATFAPFFCYGFFKRVSTTAKVRNLDMPIPPSVFAVSWVLLDFLSGLPEIYFLLGLSSVFVLLPLQSTINKINSADNAEYIPDSRFSGWNITFAILGSIITIPAIIMYFITPQ